LRRFALDVVRAYTANDDGESMRSALAELKRSSNAYLIWSGKAERTSFDIDTVSLHVHERIDPMSILAAVEQAHQGREGAREGPIQPGTFRGGLREPSLARGGGLLQARARLDQSVDCRRFAAG